MTVNGDTRILPTFVEIIGTPRVNANEMRQLQAVTGRTLNELMNDPIDAIQATVYLRLRRDGFDPTWEQAGDVDFVEVTPDPTNGEPSASSPRSAVTGG